MAQFPRLRGWSATLGIVAAAFLASCAAENNAGPPRASNGKFYSVKADKTPFFRYGPQQGNGPDTELPRDTLLTLIRPSFGYSKVQIVEDGQQGFVASDDIKEAPSTLVAAVTAPPTQASVRRNEGERFRADTNDPRLAPPPEQLPGPDLPPESPPQ